MTSDAPKPEQGRPERLSEGDVLDHKPEGWWGDHGLIYRLFEFETYQAGMDFAVRVAELAEAQNHHPVITVMFKKVKITYSTHETDSFISGVTQLDLDGAEAVNSLFAVEGASTPYLKAPPPGAADQG
ncbi:4a-hydroxytetrahydrobiopterin dehydratase [Deinococcus detaillensis]|uniref:4a-hydroxytetrahydrobiopterin dehydratase n=1 Tax=Deinococcus detaillensis TaxID=2592048 RepID=A0A553V331_9DEIO|nr:4a-hydroxytetrahydrobiopterin dehydratase [Deinococcus detaillensis]TSA86850.1 4a-hydroxytetrahydrobiopterin dehydratase [Deinococcus detaillensis]